MTKILIIEDDIDVQDNVIDILELEGFDVIAASNGLLGILMARSEKPDLIICDVMMPELDGYGVLEQLRQDSVTEAVPFIFLTARVGNLDLRHGMESGADDYLTKPFTPIQLKKAVATRLQKHLIAQKQFQHERERSLQYQKQAWESQSLVNIQEEFLRNLILDLGNPLSNINIAIQLLETSQGDEERQRYLNILKEECSREIILISQITKLQDLLSSKKLKLLNELRLLQ